MELESSRILPSDSSQLRRRVLLSRLFAKQSNRSCAQQWRSQSPPRRLTRCSENSRLNRNVFVRLVSHLKISIKRSVIARVVRCTSGAQTSFIPKEIGGLD